MTDRPSDRDLWQSVIATLRDVVLPDVHDEWARQATIQLIGLALYGRDRGPDPSAKRAAELVLLLEAHVEDPLVAPHWPAADPLAAASAILVARTEAGTGPTDRGLAVAAIRALLIRHLDEDLDGGGPLLLSFRGRVPNA